MKNRLYKIATPLVALILYGIMKLLWFTNRREIHYLTPITDEQHIIACWHSGLLMIPIYREIRPHHKASAIISQHKDGEIVAKVLRYLSINSLRGSSRRGAKKVLLEAFRSLKEGQEIQVSPDGPKGPRYHIHDGVIALASRGHLPIMIIGYKASRYWQLKSWDKFVIPKPFGKIDFYIQSLSIEGLSSTQAKEQLRAKMLEYALP